MGQVTVDWKDIDFKNKAAFKATKDGKTVNCIAAKGIVLVGAGHKKDHVDAVNNEFGDMKCSGTIQVDKGGILDKGELIVTGAKERHEFENTLRRITKKKIIFK
jgi:TATA-box binding protein (TBP) (component of TFIID and TFIIIB)